jgi:DNA polymerase III gamma/tau subunit
VVGFCGDRITNDDILSVLGTADQGFIFEMAENLINGEAQQLLVKLGRLADDGKDLAVFLREMIHHLRNLLVVKLCSEPDQLLDAEPLMVEMLMKQASSAGHSRLIRAIEILTGLEAELKWSTQPRVLFELAVVKICRPQLEDSMESLLDRIETLERQIRAGAYQSMGQSFGTEKPGEIATRASHSHNADKSGNQAPGAAEVNKAGKQAYSEANDPNIHIPLPGEEDIPNMSDSIPDSYDDIVTAGGSSREEGYTEQGSPAKAGAILLIMPM